MHDTELFRLLEHTADAAFTVDTEGVVRSWNGAAERLFGYPAAAAVGQPCADLFKGTDPLGAQVCSPDCDVRSCAVAGLAPANFDLQVRTPTGRRAWVNVSTIVAHDDHNGHAFLVHLARDASAAHARDRLIRSAEELARQLLRATETSDPLPPITALTKQELRILHLLVEGQSSAEIARRLHIKPRTLRTHVHHLNRKFRTRSRLETVVHAIRRGIVSPQKV